MKAPLWPISPSTDTRVASVVLRVIVLRSTHNYLGWMGASCSRRAPRPHHIASLLEVDVEGQERPAQPRRRMDVPNARQPRNAARSALDERSVFAFPSERRLSPHRPPSEGVECRLGSSIIKTASPKTKKTLASQRPVARGFASRSTDWAGRVQAYASTLEIRGRGPAAAGGRVEARVGRAG